MVTGASVAGEIASGRRDVVGIGLPFVLFEVAQPEGSGE